MRNCRRRGAIIAVILAAMMLASCGKSEFGVTENTEKVMVITAINAEKDAFFMVGSLEVEEGDEISIAADLTKGSVRVELVGAPEETIENMPDLSGEAAITANLQRTDGASGTVKPGSYLLRATCLETASGTVEILVRPKQS